MQKKLIYNDDSMYSEYAFQYDHVVITHNDCEDDGEKNCVWISIDRLRAIIADYDSQNEVVNAK